MDYCSRVLLELKMSENYCYKLIRVCLILGFLNSQHSQVKAFQPYKDTDVDYAASTVDLKKLVLHEQKVVQALLTHKAAVEKVVNSLNVYLDDFSTSQLQGLKGLVTIGKKSFLDGDLLADEVVKHPLASFRTIRRFAYNLPEIMKNIAALQLEDTVLESEIKTLRAALPHPKSHDIGSAASNVIRLKQMYQLDINDISKGILIDKSTNSGLSGRNSYELGLYALNHQFYNHAIDFLNKALEISESGNPDGFTPEEISNIDKRLTEAIRNYIRPMRYRRNLTTTGMLVLSNIIILLLGSVAIQHDEKIRAGLTPEDFQPDSLPMFFTNVVIARNDTAFKRRELINVKKSSALAISPLGQIARYEKLCRGEEFREPAVTSKLKCYYDSSKHVSWILSPVKVEILNEDPIILQMYDVVSDEEIQRIQTEVEAELRQSRTVAVEEEKQTGFTSRFRTSSNGWIVDHDHPRFNFINARVERLIGMEVTKLWASENLQVANYAPGGHYVIHTDAVHEEILLDHLEPSEFWRGDRIATFMIYLSDVESGGSTVFPILGLNVRPVKGSAIFWFNLHTDGSINREMLHGGCPVLFGVKWIANKWIRSHDQTFIKQCPPNQTDKYLQF